MSPFPSRLRRPAVATLTLCLTGCAAMRMDRPQDDLSIRTPGTWVAASTGNEGRISTGWLAGFNDPRMTRAVNDALDHNRNLKASAARLREVKASTVSTRARQFPSLRGSGDAGLSTAAGSSDTAKRFNLSFSSSWEPDLWGRLRDLTRAAEAEERAAIEDFRGARLSLAANTAKAWCNLISAEQDLSLSRLTLESFEKNLRIIERNYIGTGEGALDIQFGRNNVSAARRDIEASQLARDNAARSLELLLGRYPSGETRASKELPRLPATVPAGIPAQLIERRPDLASARARLFASARRADASRKSLLPSFSLTGSAGTPTSRFADLLNPDFLVTSISSGFSQVIADGGALGAEAEASLARNEAQIHQYAQLSLEAFREVEAALAADKSLAAQEKFLQSELEQAVLAERQAERDYSEGINPNILSVLEAQRRANNARGSMIFLRNQRLQNRIDLHLALGGDFQTKPGA